MEAVVDAGPAVTEASVAAWLRWQQRVAEFPRDAGWSSQRRAKEEAAALVDAGLTAAQLDEVEDVISAVVAERMVGQLTGGNALQGFSQGLQKLAPDQRQKAEAALADLAAKSPSGSLAAVEARYGAEAVKAVLSREAEVSKTWEVLLEARGE